MRSMTKSDYVTLILFTPQPVFEENIPLYWEKIRAALRFLDTKDTETQRTKERPDESET